MFDRFFRSLSMNAKFAIIPVTLILGSISIAAIGLQKMTETKSSLHEIVNVCTHRLLAARDVSDLFDNQALYEQGMLLERDPSKRKEKVQELRNGDSEINERIAALLKISDGEDRGEVMKFREKYRGWMEIFNHTVEIEEAKGPEEAFQFSRKDGPKLRAEGDAMMEDIVQRNEKLMDRKMEEVEARYKQSRSEMFEVIAVSGAMGILITYLLLSSLNRCINGVVDQLNDSSAEIATASKQIAASCDEFSASTTEQAASLAETAASVEEIDAMIQKNAESSEASKKHSERSQERARQGKEVVGAVIASVEEIRRSNDEIREKVEESNRQITEIIRVVAEIGNKTKVINDIVFQTKLLSFNASVEAARAGEHGKGFAVVAEEVGSLAQMSGNAAKEITQMLDESIRKVEQIAEKTKSEVRVFIEAAIAKVEKGKEVAGSCGQVLDEIEEGIRLCTSSATEIATASAEQASGVREISRAVAQIDQVTQTNAAATRESAIAMESLSVQSLAMRKVVERLLATVKGDKNHRPKDPQLQRAERKAKALVSDAPQVPHADDSRFDPAA